MRHGFAVMRLAVSAAGLVHTGFERFKCHRLLGAQHLDQFFTGLADGFEVSSSCLHMSGSRIDSFLSSGTGLKHRSLGILVACGNSVCVSIPGSDLIIFELQTVAEHGLMIFKLGTRSLHTVRGAVMHLMHTVLAVGIVRTVDRTIGSHLSRSGTGSENERSD